MAVEHKSSFLFPLCASCATIIAFTSKKTCEPCKKLEPVLENLKSYISTHPEAKIEFLQFDTSSIHSSDIELSVFTTFNIKTVPTLLVFSPKTRKFYTYKGPRNLTDVLTFATLQVETASTNNIQTQNLEMWTEQPPHTLGGCNHKKNTT